ncbi:hypothetical protein I5R11_17635 [Serratia marcescens]|nr:hypothetical protein [Serratia marcescens]MBH3148027.1 hypothetical protein [Serratia marcescens]
MIINEDVINKILEGTFSIDAYSVIFTQKKNAPIILKGSGSIYQDNNGNLKIKVLSELKGANSLYFNGPFAEAGIGKVIDDCYYFEMKCIDFEYNTWLSNHLNPFAGAKHYDEGLVIDANLSMIKTTFIGNENLNYTRFIISPGKVNFPSNGFTKVNNRNDFIVSTIELDDVKLELKSYDDYLIVLFSSKMTFEKEISVKVMQALNIVSGNKLHETIYQEDFNGKVHTVIRSGMLDNKGIILNQPIKTTGPYQFDDFSGFIRCYVNFFSGKNDNFFNYWWKIYKSWAGSIENSALSLTVSIEGVLNEYFKSYMVTEEDFIDEAKKTKIIIEDLLIDERIKSRLVQNLNGAGRGTPKNALYKLVTKGVISKDLADCWVKLRSKSAHAVEINGNAREQYIYDYMKCLELFYKLLFEVVGYKGKYISFSQPGWPLVQA